MAWLTNQMEGVQPITVNGTLSSVPFLTNNGTVIPGGSAPPITQVPSASRIPVDVPYVAGQSQPTTAAATAFQIGAHVAGLISNTATSTVHTATLNTTSGLMTTEALTTAAGATYTFQLVNSLITAAGPVPQVQMIDGSCTTGVIQIDSITNAAGTATVVFRNVGTAALNGTKLIAFHV